VLFSVVIVDLIGFGIVVPVLPFWATEFGAGPAAIGLLLTAYAGAQFACAPLWGRLSDRIGRRPVMLLTIAGTAASLLLLGLARSLPWLFAARALAGAFAANIGVASAYIADVTRPEERTRWMGMLGASFGVGFVLGPAIGGGLSLLGYRTPMLAAAGLSACNLVYALATLREPEGRAAAFVPGGARAGALRQPLVRQLCAANFAFTVAVNQLETVFALFMMHRFHYDASHVAGFLVAMAILMGGIQGGGMKSLATRFGERSLMIGGSALLAAGFLLLPWTHSAALLVPPLALCAVGRAVLQPSLMSVASLAAGAGERGAVMGAFQAAASLARVAGPLAAGWLYELSVPAPFLLAAALVASVALQARALPEAPRSEGEAVLVPPGA
jgi:MFS family permease